MLHHRSRLSDEPQQPLGLGWARQVYCLLTWGCPGAGAQRSSHGSAHATPASHLMMKRVPSFCSLSSMFGDALLHKFKCGYTDFERESQRVSKWHLGVSLNSKKKEGSLIPMRGVQL